MAVCRASLAFSRSSASRADRRSGESVLTRPEIARRPDLLWRNTQRFGDQPFTFGPVPYQRICQRGGCQPRLAGNRRQRRPLLFQRRDDVGRMPVRLHHSTTPSINFTPSAVRGQRGAFISAAK